MKRKVVFLEVEGGSDKGPDGHRRDTMPMVEAVRAKGWEAEVAFYSDAGRFDLFQRIVSEADAYISRVNPGNIPGGEGKYLDMLRYLTRSGIAGMSDADTMVDLGAKDALAKLAGTGFVPADTYAYYSFDEFAKKFPVALSKGDRVLKQNRGSTGEGIWHVSVVDDRSFEPGAALPLDTKVKCVEAVDNHVELHDLAGFMERCNEYLVGDDGLLVDMRFLPRVKEGEVRILMVGSKPMFVVHKVPAADGDAFSATLFSGAQYTYDSPENWSELVDSFLAELPSMLQKLGHTDVPLIWTADFIPDDGPDGKDVHVLGEINCSCVGFTSHLDIGIQDAVAEEIIRVVESRS